MKKILKSTLSVCLALIIILMPIALVVGAAVLIPAQYSNTFVGVLDEKFDRLTEIEEDKIIVVGGSSVAFGLDSALMEKHLGMPVVNFGLYASLGTKMMLDLSLAGVEDGDIVIIAPETDAQTMSLYFSSTTALQAIDDDYSMVRYLDTDNIMTMLGAAFSHVGNKISYLINSAPNPEGVYNAASFNEYGDIGYDRDKNVMELYYDPNKPISLDESLIDVEFFDYVNEYVAACERRGARVYYSFCPMNSFAMAKETSEESLAEFEALLAEALDCPLISYARDYILDPAYFYDTNFHLNETGVKYRTLKLAEDIILAEGTPILIADELPEPPALRDGLILLDGYDENEKYFTYELLPSGNYMVTGLTELGKTMEELTLPLSVRIGDTDSSVAVTAIGESAFADGCIKALTITADSYVRQMMNGAFEGSGIRRLYIHIADAEQILPPASFEGTSTAFAVYVPKESNYTTDYYWSQINVKIVESLS